MVLLQQGLQREKAGRVGILANSVVIFTYIFQVALTDDKGNGWITATDTEWLITTTGDTARRKVDDVVQWYLFLRLWDYSCD